MTPAMRALKRAQVSFELLEYRTSGDDQEVGLAAARALGLPPDAVFKTLIAELPDGRLVVALIPAATRLDMKKLARAAGVKTARLADAGLAERRTGYVTGGISPIGQKRQLPTFLAAQGAGLAPIYVSAGRRGLELALAAEDLVRLTSAVVCELTG